MIRWSCRRSSPPWRSNHDTRGMLTACGKPPCPPPPSTYFDKEGPLTLVAAHDLETLGAAQGGHDEQALVEADTVHPIVGHGGRSCSHNSHRQR